MARWADDLEEDEEMAMVALLNELVQLKPRGWSAVLGDRELVLRPANRSVGKFSFTILGSEPRIHGAFFSQSLGCWTASKRFPLDQAVSSACLDWARNLAES